MPIQFVNVFLFFFPTESLLNEQLTGDLRSLLEMLKQGEAEVTRQIPNWSIAGNIYLDYFALSDQAMALKQQEVNNQCG